MKVLLEITSISHTENGSSVALNTEILEFRDMCSFNAFSENIGTYEKIGHVEIYRNLTVIE